MVTIVDIYKNLFGRKGIQDGDVIELAEHGRVGGVSSEQGFKFTRNVDEATLIDKASSTVTYIGAAKIGTATSAASWQILKISTSGTVTSVTYSDGDENFDNVWDNRASLSYS